MDGMVGDHTGAPDLISPVAGYKVLQLYKTGHLHSPYHRACEWVTRDQLAECRKHDQYSWTNWGTKLPVKQHGPAHQAPHLDCKCGLYSYHEVGEFYERYTPVYGGLAVVALTSCWGRLMNHERGFRSEHQRIEALSVDTSDKFRLQDDESVIRTRVEKVLLLAERWGIPFVPDWRELPHVAAEMNLFPIPKSLLPVEDPSTTS
jgi:hypothetical protein